MILAPFLNIEQMKKDAWLYAKDCCERWDVPTDAPADLCDRRGRGLLTKDGFRVSAMAHPREFGWGYRSPAASLVAALLPWAVILWFVVLQIPYVGLLLAALIMVAAVIAVYLSQLHDVPTYSSKFFKKVGLLVVAALVIPYILRSQFSSIGLDSLLSMSGGHDLLVARATPRHNISNVFPFLLALWFAVNPWRKARADQREHLLLLMRSGKDDQAAAAYPFIAEASTARNAQASRANDDKTPFIELGKATGVCTELLDLYAPDKGLPVGLSQADSSTHFLTLGKTGTGKTAGIIRPFVQQWLKNQCGGLLLLDGKGDLPAEFVGTADYFLIEPGKASIGLIEGLLTEDLVDVLTSYATINTSGGGDQFWISSGETMLRSACVLLEHCPETIKDEYPWTLETVHRLINQEAFRKNLLASYRATIDQHERRAYLELAINYWLIEFPAMPANTAGSVTGTVNSWLAPLMGHRDIFDWCRTVSSEINPSHCLQGGRFGVNCPSYKYGSAGAMVSALIKARVYRAILQRGSGWRTIEGQTQVLVVADEAQEILSKADSNMFPVGRSLGLVGLIGTQSIDELIARLGRDRTYALLNNFRSFAAFQSSPLTMEWVSQQLGDVFRADFSECEGKDLFRTAKSVNAMRLFKIPRYLVGANTVFDEEVFDTEKDKDKEEKKRASFLQYKIAHRALLSPAEMSHFLNTPFQVIMQINRANVVRRDVVQTTPVFSN